MLGITRLLLGVALAATIATPALAIEATGVLQGKEKLKASWCGNAKAEGQLELELFPNGTWEAVTSGGAHYAGSYSDLGKGNLALSFDVVSYDVLFSQLTTWASEVCGFSVRILAATEGTFTARLAKGKAKGTLRFSFEGVAFDDTPGAATWTVKYKGSYVEPEPEP